jgi:Arc/MetJ-type ribon-helix-helix transcriptional regulator
MKEKDEKRALSLPVELYQRIEERVKATGFSSVDEYVIFVLDEILAEGGVSGKEEEEEEVKKRLRALGYLG